MYIELSINYTCIDWPIKYLICEEPIGRQHQLREETQYIVMAVPMITQYIIIIICNGARMYVYKNYSV